MICPTLSKSAFRPFAATSSREDMPYAAAISDSVSPDLTVYIIGVGGGAGVAVGPGVGVGPAPGSPGVS